MAQVTTPVPNTDLLQDPLKKIYWGLGPENKWMECIDGQYHDHGKNVFDEGLHGWNKEPGFISSMEKAFKFVENNFHKKIDADWYLQLHKQACSHFDGKNSSIGPGKTGHFRDATDEIVWTPWPFTYRVTKEAVAEFRELDQELKMEFGEGYGLGAIDFKPEKNRAKFIYKKMSGDKVCRIFEKFVNEFYQEIDKSTTADDKLWAIAGLHQRLEWLHSVPDGTSRTDIAVMNKLLTECRFHPAILEHPHNSSCNSRAQWKQYLQDGLLKWEQLRDKLKAIKGK